LEKSEFMAGDYSIADIATFPWAARHERHRIDLNDFPHVKRWYLAIASRPAVVKGYAVPGSSVIPMSK
jgi:GST-like protein